MVDIKGYFIKNHSSIKIIGNGKNIELFIQTGMKNRFIHGQFVGGNSLRRSNKYLIHSLFTRNIKNSDTQKAMKQEILMPGHMK